MAFACHGGMHKGIYIALSGALLKQDHLDVVSHNVANADTVGFKRGRISFRDFLLSRMTGLPQSDDGRTMSDLGAAAVDFSPGNMIRTGNPLDVALDGEGFLALEKNRFTRRGDLRIGRDGYLVTQAGLRVLGEGGPVRIPAGRVEIAPSGDVRVDGAPVAKLRIVQFADASALKELEEGYFTAALPPVPAGAQVVQGSLEAANVNVVQEMIALIATMREFETYQKTIHAFDEAAAKVNNELAKV